MKSGAMSRQTIILDTSVLLAEGKRVLYRFKDTDLVIPLIVMKELESKKDSVELSKTSRSVIREISQLRSAQPDKLGSGLSLPKNSTVRVELNHVHVSDELRDKLKTDNNDAKIIAVAYNLSKEVDHPVALATRDLSMSLYADLMGIATIDVEYLPDDRDFIDDMPTLEVDFEDMNLLYTDGVVSVDNDIPINTGVIVKSGTQSALAITKPGWNLSLVQDQSISFRGEGIKPVVAKSKEQNIAIKMLHDDTIKFVGLGGVAGSGKTMLALAKGADKVLKGEYKKITVFRSLQAVGGEELGYLPGTEEEKMDPWTAAVYDALEAFMHKNEVDKFRRENKIEVLPITHVRGRTFHNSWIIVDEAQNLAKATILTLLTRVSQSSKIVMTYDVSQRDNFRVGRWEGIYEVVSRFHGNKLFGHVAMKKSERSELAQTATDLLDDF